jgi:hypothetical protein
MKTRIIQKSPRYFTDAERHQMINEFLSGRGSKQSIWRKYTGETKEHGIILKWMRKLGYTTSGKVGITIIASNTEEMPKKELSAQEFEKLQLEKRIVELEKQLKEAELKAIAFSTMVDIAEKEFNIPIRKKYNTKP